MLRLRASGMSGRASWERPKPWSGCGVSAPDRDLAAGRRRPCSIALPPDNDDGGVVLMRLPDGRDRGEQCGSDRLGPLASVLLNKVQDGMLAQRLDAIAGKNDNVPRLQSKGLARAIDELNLRAGDGGAQIVPTWISARLFPTHLARGGQPVDLRGQRMVGIKQLDAPCAHEKQRAVANADPLQAGRGEGGGNQRAAHAVQRRVVLNPAGNCLI